MAAPFDYDPFNFMMILLFIYAILIGFIMMIIYNNIYGTRRELLYALSSRNSSASTSTTCANCIPAPTPIKGRG